MAYPQGEDTRGSKYTVCSVTLTEWGQASEHGPEERSTLQVKAGVYPRPLGLTCIPRL